MARVAAIVLLALGGCAAVLTTRTSPIVCMAKRPKSKTKAKPATNKKAAAKGFGAAASTPVVAQQLALDADAMAARDSDAVAALNAARGNIDQAQSRFFEASMNSLKAEDPDLFSMVHSQPEDPRAHAKYVELTWDTISAFMPAKPTVTPVVARRLDRIAQAALPESSDAHAPTGGIYDVGCGDGLLLPALLKDGLLADPTQYHGCDLSGRMIAATASTFGDLGVHFSHAGYREATASVTEARTIIFNGSLQFFADLDDTLTDAASRLSVNGRLVLSHVNGGAFVREEKLGNPQTVRSVMPTLDELNALAASIKASGGPHLRVLPPDALGSTRSLDDFYLVALERIG